jgi:C1A family cysteine protease
MYKFFDLFNKNKNEIKYLAEEFQIPIDFDFYKQKINGIIPPDIVNNINNYIKEYQPIIQIGLNKFKLTALLSKITSDDMAYDDFLKSTDGAKAAASSSNLPKIFMLSNILLPIRNQEQTNCCVAFSTASSIEYKNIMTKKYLDYLSPAFIYNNREEPNKDEGMTSKDAINIVKEFGVSTEQIYPFSNLKQSIQPSVYDNALAYKINGSYYIKTLDAMKIAIYNNGPVMAVLPVYTNPNQNTFWIQPSVNNKISGLHCITIVGYNDTTQKLLIRNSWGTNWGINGYQWFPYEQFNIIAESWTLLPSTNQPNESTYTTTTLNNTPQTDTSDQIIGLDPIIFYSLLAGVIIFIILIIVIILVRYRQNKKTIN